MGIWDIYGMTMGSYNISMRGDSAMHRHWLDSLGPQFTLENIKVAGMQAGIAT